MFPRTALLAFSTLAALVSAQQIGTNTAESHPKLQVAQCTKSGCTTSTQSIVLDSNWRWLHSAASGSYTNCYTGNTWDPTLCPASSATTCAQNCALDGADYPGTYGISTSGNAATLKFVTSNANGGNVGSRTYLMDSSDSKYQMFNLVGKEFTFDVDMSTLGCGLNGALYFSEMAPDGGLSTSNKAGAKYGTGYCDSQCPHDLKFVGGVANNVGWNGTTTNSGKGNLGSCCSEMDIWEANQFAAAYTPHPCSSKGLQSCTGTACDSICDQAGCDFNSWRQGNQKFLGPGSGFTIDTSKKITVVTQFIANSNGDLSEIRRKYVQNGKVIDNSASNIAGLSYNSLTDSTCAAQKTAFSDSNTFKNLGGMKAMGDAFKRGMVLVLSIWDDTSVSMLWLDSDYPTTADASKAGVNRGPCSTSSGKPADIEKSNANAAVVYSNIKWGEIDSTYTGTSSGSTTTSGTGTTSTGGTGTTSTSPTTSSGSGTGSGAAHYGQCGGTGWSGATSCAGSYTCTVINPYYSQCL
jgi:cellulose 1,4-beta-cellobiosidase